MDASNGYARKYLDACNERLKKEKRQRAGLTGKRPAVERKEQRSGVEAGGGGGGGGGGGRGGGRWKR